MYLPTNLLPLSLNPITSNVSDFIGLFISLASLWVNINITYITKHCK